MEAYREKMSQQHFDALQKELAYLSGDRRAEVAAALAEARSHGDLSENAEYDEAKNEQAILEAHIQELQYTIDNAEIVDKAVEEGKSADSIYADLYRAEKERADALAAEKANLDTIRKQAEGEQSLPDIVNPMPDDLGAKADRIAKRVAEARK